MINKIDYRKTIINLAMIALGLAIDAFGVRLFIIPNQLILGGATGIGNVASYYTGISVSVTLLAAEVVIWLAALIFLGWSYAVTILMGTFLYPLFFDMWGRIGFLQDMTNDKMIAALFGGALCGVGLGLVIRAGSSTGGSDVIPIILNKKLGLPIAPVMYVTEGIILIAQCAYSGKEEILLGLLCMVVTTVAMNRVLLMGPGDVQILIVSEQSADVREALISNDIGLSVLHGETGFLGKGSDVLLCVVHGQKCRMIEDLVHDIDPAAFMTISAVREVRGRGFTMNKVNLMNRNTTAEK